MSSGRIESVRIRGFRSLADVELADLQNANVLIGANGSGKSNFVRFFEMVSWMLRSRRLAEFVGLHGGADDQLFGGNRVTRRIEAELALRTEAGRNDYRFALAHAHPDRFVFTEEAFRFSGTDRQTEARWQLADRIRIDVDRAEDPDTGRKRSVDPPPGIAAGSWPSRKRSSLNCDLSTHGPRSLLGRPEDALSQNGRD